MIASGWVGAGTVLLVSSECTCCCFIFLINPPPYLAVPTSQCEGIKATVQKHVQNLRHSKEELNRLNQAIQLLTVEVDGTKSQVRGGRGGGWVVMLVTHPRLD